MPDLARNADGDPLLFVHAGAGDLFCDFGRLAYAAGDYLYLPAHARHRVSWTDPQQDTVWLAVHIDGGAAPAQ